MLRTGVVVLRTDGWHFLHQKILDTLAGDDEWSAIDLENFLRHLLPES